VNDFNAVPESEQAARLERVARRALAAWELESSALALVKYRENAVFAVTAADGRRRVLRVHRAGYRSDADVRTEIAWTRALAAAGVRTPEFVPTRGGDVLAHASADDVPGTRQCDLMEWVDGAPLGSLEHGVALDDEGIRQTYATIGELAARVHAHGETWARSTGFSRPVWNTDALVGDAPVFGAFRELDVLLPEQRDVLLRARDDVRARLAALGAPRLLVHGDLIPDNVLVGPAGVRVIDFDDCGTGSWVFELATSVFPLLISGGFAAGVEGFVAGYARVRPVPAAERALLPAMLLARGLSYLGWPVGRPEIHSQRELAPLYAAGMTELAERYLAGRELAG
jgi:Ser/Thr protein kinase RdoA (MazF antagonist)